MAARPAGQRVGELAADPLHRQVRTSSRRTSSLCRSSPKMPGPGEAARSGREHARPPVLVLIRDLHVCVFDVATGELIRELAIDPARNHQPTGRPPGPDQSDPDPISNLPDLLHAMHGGFVKTTIKPLTFSE
jgi:hypothetical protein